MKINPKKLKRMLNPKTVVVVGEKGPNYQFLSSLVSETLLKVLSLESSE